MPSTTEPVEDTIGKVNDEIAVGSDLEFQHRWWRFERVIWIVFGLLVLADLLGFFGRGHFAKARLRTSDGSMDVQYERIERSATPSILIVQFGPSAIHDGKVRLWASESISMKTDEGRRWKQFTTVYYIRQRCAGWNQPITNAQSGYFHDSPNKTPPPTMLYFAVRDFWVKEALGHRYAMWDSRFTGGA